MKKIISSVIAIAMLSSTVAMAKTVIAPTPQTTKVADTQNFNDAESKLDSTGRLPYWVGFGRVAAVNYSKQKYEVVDNPFVTEPTEDKVIKLGNDVLKDDSGNNPNASFSIIDGEKFLRGDIVKISFELALKNASGDSRIELSTAYTNEDGQKKYGHIRLFKKDGYVAGDLSNDAKYDHAFSAGSFKTYTVTINTVTDTMLVEYPNKESGTSTYEINLAGDKKIGSITDLTLKLEHAASDTGTPEFYINNFSCEVATLPNEKVEEFDTLKNTGNSWTGQQNLSATTLKYSFISGVSQATNEKTVEGFTTENVLKIPSTGDGFSDGFGAKLVMPLDYTMDNDDVFTFKFDYAFSTTKDNLLGFALEDYTQSTKKSMGVTFTPTNPTNDDASVTYSTSSSTLFKIRNGKIWIADRWQSQGGTMTAATPSTITVVIDNSDDTVSGSPRTLAVYVDGVLQRNTKWIMTDTGTDASTSINGVSLLIPAYNNTDSYFDNLWASLADNDIKVDGNNVSYTYPVVYDDATPAMFVKAYYDANNRLISADASASATPSTERTVTTTLNKPEGTAKTKVFRWDSLDAIQNLSPAYDSSKVN